MPRVSGVAPGVVTGAGNDKNLSRPRAPRHIDRGADSRDSTNLVEDGMRIQAQLPSQPFSERGRRGRIKRGRKIGGQVAERIDRRVQVSEIDNTVSAGQIGEREDMPGRRA